MLVIRGCSAISTWTVIPLTVETISENVQNIFKYLHILSPDYMFKGDKAVSLYLQKMYVLMVKIENMYLSNNFKTEFE